MYLLLHCTRFFRLPFESFTFYRVQNNEGRRGFWNTPWCLARPSALRAGPPDTGPDILAALPTATPSPCHWESQHFWCQKYAFRIPVYMGCWRWCWISIKASCGWALGCPWPRDQCSRGSRSVHYDSLAALPSEAQAGGQRGSWPGASLSKSQRLGMGVLAPRGRFPPGRAANKQETPSPSYFGNWAFPSATRGRIRTGSGPAARPAPSWPRPSCYGPASVDRTAPAPTRRPGMLSGPGRAGPAGLRGRPRLPAPAQPADATSRCCGSFPESYVLKRPPKSRRADCGRRRPRGGRAACRRARGLAAGVALGRRRRPGAPRGEPRAGRARRGLLSEFSPLPVGWASPAPQPPPARSREMFIWAAAWGAGGWRRGVSGPRIVARRGRDKMSARAAAAKVSTVGSVRWGPFSLCPRAAGRAVEGAGGGAGAGRGPGRCTAAASLPGPGSSSGPGPRQEGEGRAGTRNRSCREAGRGARRAGRGYPGGCSLCGSGWSLAKPCGFGLMSLSLVCARPRHGFGTALSPCGVGRIFSLFYLFKVTLEKLTS